MRASVAIVADDLTGATDTGVALLRAGLETSVIWPQPALDLRHAERTDALAIDLGTRAMDADTASRAIGEAVAALRTAGIKTLYKKIDSMMRGHVGVEVRSALQAWHPEAIALVAPAFPGVGRTTIEGAQRHNGVPIAGAAVAPAFVAAGVATRRVALHQLRDGELDRTLERDGRGPLRAIVCDAESDHDLELIVSAGLRLGERVLWVGSGGLAAGLAAAPEFNARYGAAGSMRPGREVAAATAILIVVGTSSDVARAQVTHLRETGVVHIEIPRAALAGRQSTEASALIDDVVRRLTDGADVVVSIGLSPAQDDPQLASRLGELLIGCAGLAGGVILTGGDTARAVLRGWDINGLRLTGEVEAGVPIAVAESSHPTIVVTKAGTFGRPDTLSLARDRVRRSLRPASSLEQGAR